MTSSRCIGTRSSNDSTPWTLTAVSATMTTRCTGLVLHFFGVFDSVEFEWKCYLFSDRVMIGLGLLH